MEAENRKSGGRGGHLVHCMTNPVTMQDVANVLLAAGGSAIMAQDTREAAEITAICDATLINIGVPSPEKWPAFVTAGKKANELGHPVVLDPVGAGASGFRREGLKTILREVFFSVIRCNQEEALTLLSLADEIDGDRGQSFKRDEDAVKISGGVESAVTLAPDDRKAAALRLAQTYDCTVLISGAEDVISDGTRVVCLSGGDARSRRITGSGCMLSALCALAAAGAPGAACFEAVCRMAERWKEAAAEAGQRTDRAGGGIGTFHQYLFDAVDRSMREADL